MIVTAHGREEVFEEAHKSGFEDVPIKPVSASVMFDTLIRVLSESGVRPWIAAAFGHGALMRASAQPVQACSPCRPHSARSSARVGADRVRPRGGEPPAL